MSSSQTPPVKKVERGKICQFRCLSLKGNTNSQQVTPQACESQVAGKAVPPLTKGTTLQSSTEGTRNSHWTPQAQKKFSPFIWHRNKSFLLQVKEKKIIKTNRSLPRDARLFFSKCLQAEFWFQGGQSSNPTLPPCTWAIQAECSGCKSQLTPSPAAQLLPSILPAPLCLHPTTHPKGFWLCVRDSQVWPCQQQEKFLLWFCHIETPIASSCSIPGPEQNLLLCLSVQNLPQNTATSSKPLLWLIANCCLPP